MEPFSFQISVWCSPWESCWGHVSPLQATAVMTTYKHLLAPLSLRKGSEACMTLGLSGPDTIYPLARNWPLTMAGAHAGWMF